MANEHLVSPPWSISSRQLQPFTHVPTIDLSTHLLALASIKFLCLKLFVIGSNRHTVVPSIFYWLWFTEVLVRTTAHGILTADHSSTVQVDQQMWVFPIREFMDNCWRPALCRPQALGHPLLHRFRKGTTGLWISQTIYSDRKPEFSKVLVPLPCLHCLVPVFFTLVTGACLAAFMLSSWEMRSRVLSMCLLAIWTSPFGKCLF